MNEPTLEQLFAMLDAAQATNEALKEELPQIGENEKLIDALKAEIRKQVEFSGSPAEGSGWEAVFQNRPTWDGDLLAGYAIAHPEVLACKKTTTSVVIRRKRGKK